MHHILYHHGYERECKYGGVDIYEKEGFTVGIVGEDVLSKGPDESVFLVAPSQIKGLEGGKYEPPTLARKLETVHKKTVSSNNTIPNVRLATPINPNFALSPDLELLLPLPLPLPVVSPSEDSDDVRARSCTLVLSTEYDLLLARGGDEVGESGGDEDTETSSLCCKRRGCWYS